jgi:hypothetical protein
MNQQGYIVHCPNYYYYMYLRQVFYGSATTPQTNEGARGLIYLRAR